MVSNVSSKMPSSKCSPCSSMRPCGPRLLAPLPPSLQPRWYTVSSSNRSRQRPSDNSRAAESAAIPPPRMATRGRLPDPPSAVESAIESGIEEGTSVEDPGTFGAGGQHVVHAAQHAAPVGGPGPGTQPRQVDGGAERQHQRPLRQPDLDGGTQVVHDVVHPAGAHRCRELRTQAQEVWLVDPFPLLLHQQQGVVNRLE